MKIYCLSLLVLLPLSLLLRDKNVLPHYGGSNDAAETSFWNTKHAHALGID